MYVGRYVVKNIVKVIVCVCIARHAARTSSVVAVCVMYLFYSTMNARFV